MNPGPEQYLAPDSTPGVPGVLMYGHNHHVAWSVTNAIADVSDLFVERFNDDFTQYEHEISAAMHLGICKASAARRAS